MAEPFKRRALERIKRFYRGHWLPLVRSCATALFRAGVDLATAAGMVQPAQPGDPPCFLIINLAGHLGDTVMLLPMIEALNRAHPSSRIEVAVAAAAAPLLQSIDLIDRVHTLHLPSQPPTTLWLALKRAIVVLRQWWPLRRKLRATTVLLPRWGDDLFRSTMLAYLTQAPRRIGFASHVSPKSSVAPYRDALLTDLVSGGSGMHEPARFVYLLEQAAIIPLGDPGAVSSRPVKALQTAVAKVDFAELGRRFNLAGRYAVLAPGASMPRRIYPVEKWLPAVEFLASRGIATVILAGHADARTARDLHLLAPAQTTLLAGVTDAA